MYLWIYLSIYLLIYQSVSRYVCINICWSVYVWVHLSFAIYVDWFLCVCRYAGMYALMHVWICVTIEVNVYNYIYILFIYTQYIYTVYIQTKTLNKHAYWWYVYSFMCKGRLHIWIDSCRPVFIVSSTPVTIGRIPANHGVTMPILLRGLVSPSPTNTTTYIKWA